MTKKNVLLLCGGSGTEHEISLVSAQFIEKNLQAIGLYNVIYVEIGRPKSQDKTFRTRTREVVEINSRRQLVGEKGVIADLHYVVPCIHGPPGETGEIQTYLELISLPYLGCGPEACLMCFNKVTNKLWLKALGIPNTPFEFITSMQEVERAHAFFDRHGKVFVKAASQGSSVGCYPVSDKSQLTEVLEKAFGFSSYVLIEVMLVGRELEISTYEFQGQVHASRPGEIKCPPNGFYSYEEKYDAKSQTTTHIEAQNLPADVVEKMRGYALAAFRLLKLRHLSRIDFFYTDKGEIYLNEINTFPGATPISMFPKMMEHNGHPFLEFIKETIQKDIL